MRNHVPLWVFVIGTFVLIMLAVAILHRWSGVGIIP
jgi:hypothetical protein